MSVIKQISAGSKAGNLAEELLLPSELARMIGKTERTLANWRCARIGPRFVKLGNSVRYPARPRPEAITRSIGSTNSCPCVTHSIAECNPRPTSSQVGFVGRSRCTGPAYREFGNGLVDSWLRLVDSVDRDEPERESNLPTYPPKRR